MGFLQSIGHALGSVASKAAPIAGMIPGVGTIAATGLGALGGALEPGGGLKGALKGGAMGAAGGLVSKIPGVQSMLGKVGSTLGSSLGDTFMPGGKLDLGRVAGAGGALMNFIGQQKQRASAENYNNAQIDSRNGLMQQLTSPNNFNLPDISAHVKDAATPVGGPKITPNQNPLVSKKLTAGQAPVQ